MPGNVCRFTTVPSSDRWICPGVLGAGRRGVLCLTADRRRTSQTFTMTFARRNGWSHYIVREEDPMDPVTLIVILAATYFVEWIPNG